MKNVTFPLFMGIGVFVAFVGCVICFFVHIAAGIIMMITCAMLLVGFFLFTHSRYREIDELIKYLNRVLHGNYGLDIAGNKEGELKILKSEIYKMTVMLRKQADSLRQDKRYLADSIADISHQLRTPLTSMNLALSLLSREGNSAEQQKKLLREISLLLRRMDFLITALLKISKIDAGTADFQKERVFVSNVLRNAEELVAIPMELRCQSIEIQGDSTASFIGDEMWTVEAIGNILKNCMEHMDTGGKITIVYEENALYTQILIRDTGKGIDKEDLPHIFERFYRGKNADSNSFGIGLALSRMIINEQNGTIKAANLSEGGMCFTVRFYKGAI